MYLILLLLSLGHPTWLDGYVGFIDHTLLRDWLTNNCSLVFVTRSSLFRYLKNNEQVTNLKHVGASAFIKWSENLLRKLSMGTNCVTKDIIKQGNVRCPNSHVTTLQISCGIHWCAFICFCNISFINVHVDDTENGNFPGQFSRYKIHIQHFILREKRYVLKLLLLLCHWKISFSCLINVKASVHSFKRFTSWLWKLSFLFMHLLPRKTVMLDFTWTLPVQLRGTRIKWILQIKKTLSMVHRTASRLQVHRYNHSATTRSIWDGIKYLWNLYLYELKINLKKCTYISHQQCVDCL